MKKPFLLALSMGVLAGCDTGFSGGPKSSLDPNRNFSEIVINTTLNVPTIQSLAAQSVVDPQQRNRVIEARLAEIDILYFQYESALSADLRRGGFSTNVLSLLIGAAGAQASGATSQQLSALGGLVTGVSTAYQKEVLLEQSLQAFISQMRASRNQVKAEIYENMTRPGESYSLQAALADLAAYEQAGTIISAVASVTQQAQTQEVIATQSLQKAEEDTANDRVDIVSRPLNSTVATRSLTAFIARGGPANQQQQRFDAVNTCFDSAQATKPATITEFLTNQGQFDDLAKEIATCLGI